jgi:hypothetical protein
MNNTSHELMLIYNLANASKWHKANCHENCNVSIHQLKEAALFIERFMSAIGRSNSEVRKANEVIEGMESI